MFFCEICGSGDCCERTDIHGGLILCDVCYQISKQDQDDKDAVEEIFKDKQLPEGKTCADCAHIERCMMMFHGNPKNTMCGWEPIKFKEIPCSWNDRQKKGCEEWCGLPFC